MPPGLTSAIAPLFAQAANAAAGEGNSASAYLTFLPTILLVGFWFWLIMIRPQQKQERERRAMLGALKKNDKVLTNGGIYGTVISVDESQDRVMLRIDDEKGVRVAFSKASIVRVNDPNAEKDKAQEKDKASGNA